MKTPSFSVDPTEFAGKRALVTGGTKGAGEAIVRRLAQAGAEVITTARSAAVAQDLPARFIPADLTTLKGAQALVEAIQGEN
jgi:NAD(P)-dependent dehydrogenase (short-subunit alcohol dehydrogenase family)